jgi:hypothetical protein
MRHMADRGAPGTASPPPTLGEGCVRRYDPDALQDGDGTEFPGAAELWRQLQTTELSAGEDGPAQDKPDAG